MKVIGLCGGSGSGKGEVCSLFNKMGIPTIDTDAVYRELTGPNGQALSALEKEFGSDIITENNSLNRKALADIVFCGNNSALRLARLNEISHKFILDETRARLDRLSQGGFPYAIVDAPVLFESKFDSECDAVICVIADRELRIERVMCRDRISRAEAERRIASQISDDELVLRSDFVIKNNSDIDALRDQVYSLHKKIIDNNYER